MLILSGIKPLLFVGPVSVRALDGGAARWALWVETVAAGAEVWAASCRTRAARQGGDGVGAAGDIGPPRPEA